MNAARPSRGATIATVALCACLCPCGLADVGFFGAGAASAQQASSATGLRPAPASAATSATTLTVDDYIQIRQLVANYAFALDGGANAGFAYADLFAPGAEFIRPPTTGRENLAKLALDQPHGPLYARHFITNHVIESSPTGVTGKQYLLVIDVSETREKPGTIFLAGHYEDRYAKTPQQGWRFMRREFIQSRAGQSGAPQSGTAQPRVAPAPTPAAAPR
jgi:hypothetical protein